MRKRRLPYVIISFVILMLSGVAYVTGSILCSKLLIDKDYNLVVFLPWYYGLLASISNVLINIIGDGLLVGVSFKIEVAMC